MQHIKSKYSFRLLIPSACYLMLFIFTIKYVSEVLARGHFFFPDLLESKLLDKFLCSVSVLVVLLFPLYLKSNLGTLEIIGNEIILKPLFGKKRKYNLSEITADFKYEFTRSDIEGKYVIIRNESHSFKFKLSQYYHQNYNLIENILRSSSKDKISNLPASLKENTSS
jgi:hypothetical protein